MIRQGAQTADRQQLQARASALSGANIERAGEHNQRILLQAIRISGPIARVELASLTGLTAPAVTNITRRLIQDGFIREAGKVQGARGQPAQRLEVNPDGAFSIGLNIDRDHIGVVVMDLAGQVRAHANRDMPFPRPEDVKNFYNRSVKSFIDDQKIIANRVVGVGIAMPDGFGSVNLPQRPVDYEEWNTVNLKDLVTSPLDIPVFLENDAAAAAIGEQQFGHGLDKPTFFYLLISAGLGGGLVVDRRYYRGAQGRSGEIGFLPINGSGHVVQDEVSLSALYRRLEHKGLYSRPQTEDERFSLESLTGEARLEVESFLEKAAELLEAPLTAIGYLINPDAVFIGGRLPGILMERLADKINSRLQASSPAGGGRPNVVLVRKAALAEDAPGLGAAILPFCATLLPSDGSLTQIG